MNGVLSKVCLKDILSRLERLNCALRVKAFRFNTDVSSILNYKNEQIRVEAESLTEQYHHWTWIADRLIGGILEEQKSILSGRQ